MEASTNSILVIGEWQLSCLEHMSFEHHNVHHMLILPPDANGLVSSASIWPLSESRSAERESIEITVPGLPLSSSLTAIEFLNVNAISSLPTLLSLSCSAINSNEYIPNENMITYDIQSILASIPISDTTTTTIEQDWMRQGSECFENMDMSKALWYFESVLNFGKPSYHPTALYNASCIYHYWEFPILAMSLLYRFLLLTPTDAIVHNLFWTIATATNHPPPKQLTIRWYASLVHAGSSADPIAATRLAVLTGQGQGASRTDRAYVRDVFDAMAEVFEEKLTVHLQYDAPWILEQQIHRLLTIPDDTATERDASALEALANKKGQWRILDLGCGSGLCAKIFRDYFVPSSPSSSHSASENQDDTAGIGTGKVDEVSLEEFGRLSGISGIVGIDISPKMIELCRSLQLYRSVASVDVYDALSAVLSGMQLATPGAARRLDMVIAADTFVYVGALGRLFHMVHEVLEPGGLFAFSTEDLEASPMRMSSSAIPDSSTTGGGNTHLVTTSEAGEKDEENKWEIPGAVPGWGAELLRSARFGHSNRYIASLAEQYGFIIVAQISKTLRIEGSIPLLGAMVVLQKQ
jgi:predicted TPR repeat methyltransferase